MAVAAVGWWWAKARPSGLLNSTRPRAPSCERCWPSVAGANSAGEALGDSAPERVLSLSQRARHGYLRGQGPLPGVTPVELLPTQRRADRQDAGPDERGDRGRMDHHAQRSGRPDPGE